MSGEAAELEKVEEILADPSGHSTLFSGSALEIHVSKLPNLNNLLIDLATQQLAKELSDCQLYLHMPTAMARKQ